MAAADLEEHKHDACRRDDPPPFVTSDTLVLISPDRAAEVWDVPPARRWEWIIGVPAALALLPWLVGRAMARRPRAPASGTKNATLG